MKKIIAAVLLVVGCGFLAFRGSRASGERPLVPVSMIQVIANPQQFEGKEVSVVGFYLPSGEGDYLFLHAEDSRNFLTANALGLQTELLARERRSALSGKYVSVRGRVRILPLGNVPAAEITDIRSIDLRSDPQHPFLQRLEELHQELHRKKTPQ